MFLKFAIFVLFLAVFVDNISNQQDEYTFVQDSNPSLTCFNQILYNDEVGHPNHTVSNCAECEVSDIFLFLFYSDTFIVIFFRKQLIQIRDVKSNKVTQEVYECSSVKKPRTGPGRKSEIVTPDDHYIVQYCTCEEDRF